MIGEFLKHIPDDSLVIVCSDHGAGPVFGEARSSGGHSNSPSGVLIMRGPNIKKNHEIEDASVNDLMSTMCYLAGIPISSTWSGRVLKDAIESSCLESYPELTVPAYPMPNDRYRGPQEKLDRDLNEELKEQLKALGYIG